MALTSITPPWDAWALDKQFLVALDKWIKDHPDKKLDTVLESICTAIDSGKDLMGFIPDSPFPARSLVQGLGGLVRLGNTVRKAKSSAVKFAKKIVQWIEDIVTTFQDGNTGQFTEKTWDNLDNIRVLVDEICQWANVRLGSSRLSLKMFNAESEIQEFQSRIDEATGYFMRLSMISLLKGHDLLSAKIDKAHGEIETAREEIETILEEIHSLKAHVQQRRIEEQFLVDCTFIEKELCPFIAADSGYRDQGKEFCSPGTRVERLDKIDDWLSDFSTEASHFLWITGDPGSGKSTIAATMCRKLRDSRNLWAELFINRNYRTTTDTKKFFPSIALQLAKRSPEVARVISHALQEKPSLVDDITEAVAERLFIEPLILASKTTPNQAVVVVVDALDEVDAGKLSVFAELLSKITTHLAANIKVLIFSREEEVIRVSWATAPDTTHLSVGTSNRSSIEDVASLLKQKIQDIVAKYELTGWPGKEKMQKLVLQASGLFIWATTAIKYIHSQIDIYGSECLDDVLDQLNEDGMGDINLLYGTILEKMYPSPTDPWASETFRRVVGSIVALNTPFSLGVLETVLDLRKTENHRRVDVIHFVKRLRTVLGTGTDSITRETVPHLHKSFVEFVTGKNIRPDLQVSLLLSHRELAPKCLAHSVDVGDSYFHAARFSYQWTVNGLPNDHPDLPAYLGCFGDLEHANYQHCHEVASLNTSISVFTRLIQVTQDGHPDKPSRLNSLANYLLIRFKQLHDLGDLNRVVLVLEDAAGLTPNGDPDKPSMLNSLGNSLHTRFKQLGDLGDLNRAVLVLEDAALLTQDGHLDKPSMLNSLGNSLLTRFKELRDLGDLNKAVLVLEDAAWLTQDGHPDKRSMLNSLESALLRLDNLGNFLLARFERLSDLGDLNQSILNFEAAVTFTLDGDRSGSLNNLANALLTRFEQTGQLADLEESIGFHRQALELRPGSHPNRSGSLNNLASALSRRFDQTGQLADLEESIGFHREALELRPGFHPNRSSSLNNLANALSMRFEQTGQLADLDESMICFRDASVHGTSAVIDRFRSSRRWARKAASFNHSSAMEAYEYTINLLPRLASLDLNIRQRQEALTRARGLACDACSYAIQQGMFDKAVEFLCTGRAVFWAQALQLHTPLDELQSVAPHLALKLRTISNALEDPSAHDGFQAMPDGSKHTRDLEQEATRRRILSKDWNDTLEAVRNLESFGGFLLSKSISELRMASSNGPVVLLKAADSGCDALVVTQEEVKHIPLPDLSIKMTQCLGHILRMALSSHGARSDTLQALLHPIRTNPRLKGVRMPPAGHTPDDLFGTILGMLWFTVAHPVIDVLDLKKPDDKGILPRIWWCPTGPFAFLPIHAAGVYEGNNSECLSDYTISSYIPTLDALLVSPPPKVHEPKMLAVIQHEMPGDRRLDLHFALEELGMIQRHVPNTWLTKLGTKEEPTSVGRVLSLLPGASFVHFACHGLQDLENPLESALLLGDGDLKVSKIMQNPIQNASLAFLSACETAKGDEKVPDEAMHLAGTMLFGGFRGVVGTMWTMHGEDGPEVVDVFYNHIFGAGGELHPDSTKAAEALHLAVNKLRTEKKASFQRWVPFIHLGL